MNVGKIIKSFICMGGIAAIIVAGIPNGLHNAYASELTMNGVARNAASAENADAASKNAAVNVLAEESVEPEDNPEISVDITARDDGYSAVLYDNTNGLPTAEANAIESTRDGFIWIGSYSGLIRYDGNTFERIDSTTGIASVVSLYADSKDRLWIGTNDSGVALMEKGSLKMFTKADGLMSSSIRSITEDEEGNICYVIGVTKKIRSKINKRFGDEIDVSIKER